MIDEFEAIGEEPQAGFVRPPAWPRVLGIISICVAGFGLICGGLGMLVTPFLPGMMKSQLNGAPAPAAWTMRPIDLGLGIVGLALSVLLLFGGIWLVSRRPAARAMHLVYALVAMPLNIFFYIHNLNKQASLAQWARDYPDNPIAQSQQGSGQLIGQVCGMALMLGVGVLFPLFLFVWFGLFKTRKEQITGTEQGVY